MDLAAAVAHIPFREQERARANLAKVAERLPAGTAETLPSLLTDSPDPDTALNFLERLCAPENAEAVRLFGRSGTLLHYAIAVFGYSPWLGETLLQNTDLLHALAREKNLDRSHSREDFREAYARFSSRSFETDVSLLLARFKRREYVRILLRDVLGIATLAEVTAEISALSDVLIEEALRHADMQLRNRHGAPQVLDAHGRVLEAPFAVLSLGKLGGNELNYSSDIDLLFLYGEGEQPAAAELGERISNREYFIRLSQQVTEVLSRVTPEGSVFRIDLRLRPQGREGEPAVGLGHALRYYSEEAAHDWERQALIKVRYSAGSVVLAREFIRGVQAHVYRGELNFEAIETALNTREKIGAHRRRHKLKVEATLDVKLDRGGIRDIEFLVQCLQRVYGGAEPWLRSGGTLFSLQKLHDKGHLGGKDFHQLNLAYTFLRKVEHRLQIRRGQQTHRLPAEKPEVEVLERAVGREELQRAEPLGEMLRRHMEAVAEIYERIIHAQQRHGQEREAGEFYLSPSGDGGREQSYVQVLERFALDSPEVYEIVSRRDITARTRRNLHRFLSAAFTSSERYAAVVRAPQAIERALRIFAVSDHLTDILVRHPELIATVADIDETPRGAGKLFASIGLSGPVERDPVFEYLASSTVSHSEKLALLRQHYRHRAFASGVRDVLELRQVYDSLYEMSDAADDAVAAAFSIASAPKGFAVLALGRLGTWEFDLASDADLLFVRDEAVEETAARKATESMMEALASYTRDGTVFAVDARLRPRGAEGELVSTPSGLDTYFAEEAQAWEALTYTKLRYVAGDEELAQRALEAVRLGSGRFRRSSGFAAEVRAMRTKLEKSDTEPNFKVCPGGVYDLDFLAGFLLVKHGVEAEGNLRERLHVLAETGRLSDGDCATLDNAAELFRTTEHVVRLVTGRARKALPATEHGREVADSLTARILGWDSRGGLAEELERTFAVVRGLFDRVVAPG